MSPTLTTVRLFLHVISASIWVGGQIVLGGLVPKLRRAAPETTKIVANAFARIAWPAYGVLVLTGFWNVAEVDVANTTTAYQITLFVKIALAIASGAAAAIHSYGRSKMALAVGGAVGLITGLAAMFVGILLTAGGS